MTKIVLVIVGLSTIGCSGDVDLGGGMGGSTAGGMPSATGGSHPVSMAGSHPVSMGGSGPLLMGDSSKVGGTTVIPNRGPALEANAYACGDVSSRCAASVPGHVIAYSNEAEFVAMGAGAWLLCAGGYLTQFGIGLYISADHRWSALAPGSDGECVPVTTSFDSHGTWSLTPVGDNLQFTLHPVVGGGSVGTFFPLFSDTDQMRLEDSGINDYTRAPAL